MDSQVSNKACFCVRSILENLLFQMYLNRTQEEGRILLYSNRSEFAHRPRLQPDTYPASEQRI